MTYILIGAGSRGLIYGQLAKERGVSIAAIAEKRPDRLNNAAKLLDVPEHLRFSSAEDLLSMEKQADAAIIATQDKDHYGHVMLALERGYHVLLEKPISPDPKECMEIAEKANRLGLSVTVCHVLRYTPFWGSIKEILDSRELGKVVAIKHSENIGNFHMAHSFVRGNWRKKETSAPIILAKSCHDLDILLWLTNAHCRKVSAFGSLSFFKEENAPEGSTKRCFECPLGERCRFHAWRVYQPTLGKWPTDVVCLEQTEPALRQALETGPYGQCVFRCDNDVCDHMSMILELDGGITATFSLTAQSSLVHRNIHIMCEHGEIEADDSDGHITVTHFPANQAEKSNRRTIFAKDSGSGHGGGDSGILNDFTDALLNTQAESRSSISRSVESHLMAFAIEQSRLTGKTLVMDDFKASLTPCEDTL